jgi:putative transposase
MVSYRRNRIAGGKFFTADLRDRQQKVLVEHIDAFRNVVRGVRREISSVLAKGRRGDYGLWQKRYGEHTVRDDRDFEVHVNYVHTNPVNMVM